jgi:hypothetical protein
MKKFRAVVMAAAALTALVIGPTFAASTAGTPSAALPEVENFTIAGTWYCGSSSTTCDSITASPITCVETEVEAGDNQVATPCEAQTFTMSTHCFSSFNVNWCLEGWNFYFTDPSDGTVQGPVEVAFEGADSANGGTTGADAGHVFAYYDPNQQEIGDGEFSGVRTITPCPKPPCTTVRPNQFSMVLTFAEPKP